MAAVETGAPPPRQPPSLHVTLRSLIPALAIAAALLVIVGVLMVVSSVIAAGRPDVAALARAVPARTALMRQRAAEARRSGREARVVQRWVPYRSVSPLLRRAVLIAEDGAFFSHDGLDWHEISASMRRNLQERRIVRGGSTITQQLARNLYLGDRRTLTRKLTEMVLAGRIERALSKQRIFEIYLNVIEWGDGIYGIEAAAWHHFGVPAAALDARQSALLAAVIINPRRYDPVRPAGRVERRSRIILGRMTRRGFLSDSLYREALGLAPLPATAESIGAAAPDTALPVGLLPEPGPAPDSSRAPAADTLAR